MVVKKVRINGKVCSIAGVSQDDPYFSGIGDECEPEFLNFCHRYIHDDYFCFDIGANIGVKTLALSGFASSGRVAAFEPGPTIYTLLRHNIEENGISNVDSMNVAIGANDGIVRFVEDSAYGHITESSGGIEMASRSLTSALNELKYPRLDFVKIDVEGFEFEILRSSVEVLREQGSLVYFEFNCFAQIAFDQPSPKAFLDWIFANFPFVYVVNKNADPAERLSRVGGDDVIHLVHQNMLDHGCITDFVVTTDVARLAGTPRHMESRLDALLKERDQSRSDLQTIRAEASVLREKIASLKARQDKHFVSKDQSWSRRIKKLMGLTKN
jgi:FkbM family methyltransferase